MQFSPKKSLGQHWLNDDFSLTAMLRAGQVSAADTVLEIGPGKGSLTRKLCAESKQVIAVELDKTLAEFLRHDKSLKNLKVIEQDILEFDLSQLPKDYKVIANIPYYLTSNLIRVLLESTNPPCMIVLLVQKEVAERIDAKPGAMSILSVSVQLYAKSTLKEVVLAELFTPPPKVDSQIIQIVPYKKPLFPDVDTEKFFQIVRAGFSEKRKKLRSSLSGGLHISKDQADDYLKSAGIGSNVRAQELELEQWYRLHKIIT